MSGLDRYILKELDRQGISSYDISIIMYKLNNIEKKNKFLNYLVDNRIVLLNKKDITNYIDEELNE